MSDVMPKIKTYLFISVIQLMLNIGIYVFSLDNIDNYLMSFSATVGEAFLPFVSLINLGSVGILEGNPVAIISGIVTGIMSGLQTLIILFIGFQILSNLIWHPDV